MRKKIWMYICDICGEMKPEETYYCGDGGSCREAPNGWKTDVGAGKLCLCSTCYNSLVMLKDEQQEERRGV